MGTEPSGTGALRYPARDFDAGCFPGCFPPAAGVSPLLRNCVLSRRGDVEMMEGGANAGSFSKGDETELHRRDAGSGDGVAGAPSGAAGGLSVAQGASSADGGGGVGGPGTGGCASAAGGGLVGSSGSFSLTGGAGGGGSTGAAAAAHHHQKGGGGPAAGLLAIAGAGPTKVD